VSAAGESANRAAIALRLADVLTAHGADFETAADLPATYWAKVAELANCRPGYVPSTETRDVAVAILRTRICFAADPFAGL
jgi:hypothetical protein